MKIDTSSQKIKELLTRGIEEVISLKSLEKKLKSGKKLRVKLGADPSRPDLHLGHAVVLRKLKEFQDLGHQIVFIIGDYTGMIGDPSGKSATRPQLSLKEVEKNAQTYFKQVGKILDIKKAEIRKNGEWFSKMKFSEVLSLTSQFTVQRILERDDFTNRIKDNHELGIHELLYPIMQAYDSVAISADVEIGGTDQRFNMLTGRKLQRRLNLPEQDVITVPLLIGLDGKNKMSKSLDNYIGITEPADSQYGKIMSISDDLITNYFELATELPIKEINNVKAKLKTANPRDIKMQLAREVAGIYHGQKEASAAESNFVKVFQKKDLPDEMREKKVKNKEWNIVDLLLETKLAPSKNEARRLISQKGISVDGKNINESNEIIKVSGKGVVVKKGKRFFVKVVL